MSRLVGAGLHGMDTSILAVAVCVVAAFVISAAWYAVWGRSMGRLHPAYAAGAPARPPAATFLVEVVRNLAITLVAAWMVSWMDVTRLAEGLGLGLALWVGFPAIILAGSVFHERVPPLLAAIHAGDWLLKLLAICALLSVWS